MAQQYTSYPQPSKVIFSSEIPCNKTKGVKFKKKLRCTFALFLSIGQYNDTKIKNRFTEQSRII